MTTAGRDVELTEFLLARIAEDEAVARDVQFQTAAGRPFFAIIAGGDGIHRLTSPDHWLVECEAKRRIVAHIGEHERPAWTRGGKLRALRGGHEVLRALALPYRDHPDYDPAWAD